MTIRDKNGPLTMAQIQGEYGGPFPYSLGDLYRGGSKVPLDAPASDNFQTDPMFPLTNIQVPTSGTIQMSHFYGQSAYVAPTTVPGPAPQLIFNSSVPSDAYDEYHYWTAPVTGTVYVTIVGHGGGRGMGGGNLWDTGHDSTGGNGGGSGGEILYRQAISVTKGQAIPYKAKPETFPQGWDPQGGGGGQSEEPTYGVTVGYISSPITEFNGILTRGGAAGFTPNRYTGGIGATWYDYYYETTQGQALAGGRGGNSVINQTGQAGSPGQTSAYGGAGGAGGAGGGPGQLGSQGYGFGGAVGGWYGTKGSDNDVPGGGGGGAGGFIPPGYPSTYLAQTGQDGIYSGGIGCIYIEYDATYPAHASTGPLSATVENGYESAGIYYDGGFAVIKAYPKVFATGGTANYTYNWTVVSTTNGYDEIFGTNYPVLAVHKTVGNQAGSFPTVFNCAISDGVTTINRTVNCLFEFA